jgi:hypothetical protein
VAACAQVRVLTAFIHRRLERRENRPRLGGGGGVGRHLPALQPLPQPHPLHRLPPRERAPRAIEAERTRHEGVPHDSLGHDVVPRQPDEILQVAEGDDRRAAREQRAGPSSGLCLLEKVALLVIPVRRLFGHRKDGSGAVSRAIMASVRFDFGFDTSPNLRSEPTGDAAPRCMVGLDFIYFWSVHQNSMRQRCCVHAQSSHTFQALRN